jgi:glycosyltransferase involved in cell wall biosynthesis
MLSGSRKWQALRGCEALVLPSRHENFGVVVAEALSCGRPVLLTDKVNTHREVVEAGAGLCETDTKHGVMTMLTRWQSTEARSRACMSAAALEVFETDFSMKGCAVRFLSVVRELLHSPAVRSPVPTGHRHS